MFEKRGGKRDGDGRLEINLHLVWNAPANHLLDNAGRYLGGNEARDRGWEQMQQIFDGLGVQEAVGAGVGYDGVFSVAGGS